MAVSYACPGCATPLHVTAEMAGKRAKCPKCQMMVTLPVAPAGSPTGSDPDVSKRAEAALDDAFQDANGRDSERKRSTRGSRSDDPGDNGDKPWKKRASRTDGSTLPWVLGIGGAALVLFLFCGGAIAVIAVVAVNGRKNRPDEPAVAVAVNNPPVIQPIQPPIGNNAALNPPGFNLPPGAPIRGIRVNQFNGFVRIDAQLVATDAIFANVPGQPVNNNKRCKEYVIDLQANRTYTIDLESNQFDAYLHLEELRGQLIAVNDDAEPGRTLNARIIFTPIQTKTYVIVATSLGGGSGAFTLTVRAK